MKKTDKIYFINICILVEVITWFRVQFGVNKHEYIFQILTKLHEPVRRVQFVILEKINKCLFNPNCTRKIMWLLINNIHEQIRDSLS